MSVYTRSGYRHWQFDYQQDGRRFSGSFDGRHGRPTVTADRPRKEAERAETILRVQVPTADRPRMTLYEATARYWSEVAQFFKDSAGERGRIAHLERLLGKNVSFEDLTDDKIAVYVSTRRAETARHKRTLITSATINRELECLGRVRRRAEKVWRIACPDIAIALHKLREPRERVRVLTLEEDQALFAAIDEHRPDFRDVFEFLLLSGKRLSEVTMLEKRRVDRRAMRATVTQKGGGELVMELTPDMLAIIERNWMYHPTRVFTYVCQRNRTLVRAGVRYYQHKGQRYPFTKNGWRGVWGDILKAAKIENFRVHDLRHTAATRVLAATGNLGVVQAILGHSDISTTAKYAHVDADQIRDASEKAAQLRVPLPVPVKGNEAAEK